uniref:Uncharacterized protein n=1 Tax=Timema poppense TaxID=170557 RepID=A0A7R9D2I7_TIMPO|nr:unnamed protein product [Timema poppensis]
MGRDHWEDLHKWEDNIRRDLKELGCNEVDWIELAQSRDRVYEVDWIVCEVNWIVLAHYKDNILEVEDSKPLAGTIPIYTRSAITRGAQFLVLNQLVRKWTSESSVRVALAGVVCMALGPVVGCLAVLLNGEETSVVKYKSGTVFVPSGPRRFIQVELTNKGRRGGGELDTNQMATFLCCAVTVTLGVLQVMCPLYVVSVMSKSAGQVIARNRSQGAIVFGEALAASIGTDGTHQWNKCWQHAAAHITCPPLRPDTSTPQHIMDFLASDVLQVTASDNCTFTTNQKARGKDDFSKIPTGVNGVEDRMSVVWEKGVHSGIIDPTRFVAITSTNAAKIFNLYPRKDKFTISTCLYSLSAKRPVSASDAFLPDKVKNRRYTRGTDWPGVRAKTSPSPERPHVQEQGMECHGVPEFVIVNGRVCVDEGHLKAVQGFGHFVSNAVHSPFVYDQVVPQEEVTVKKDQNSKQVSYTEPERNGLESEDAQNNTPLAVLDSRPVDETPLSPSQSELLLGCPSSKGQRNLQDSTFSISAELDDSARRACIRVKNPPGGQSSGGFW